MQRSAHAKLNLALAVDRPTPPAGYHPLCSWFAALSLADDVTILPAPSFSFHVRWAPDAPKPTPIDWPAEKDLCVRAHHAFEQHCERSIPVRIEVAKRIPVGGGLGGGSSDAAAVLMTMRELFAPKMSVMELISISKTLGSDVAFFCDISSASPRRAIVEGFGERVHRVDDGRQISAVLIIPPFPCATRDVYAAADSLADNANSFEFRCDRVRSLALSEDSMSNRGLFNDLAAAAQSIAPRLNNIISIATNASRRDIHVTGSGSTLFTLVTEQESDSVRETLSAALFDHDCAVIGARVLS